MKTKSSSDDVLVIGAGITGIEASLLLSNAGKKVHLVEKTSYIGGTVIKFEEVFSNMECSTCMVAPRQQELLQDKNINLILLAEVEEVKDSPEGFIVKIYKKARYVDLENCTIEELKIERSKDCPVCERGGLQGYSKICGWYGCKMGRCLEEAWHRKRRFYPNH